VASEVPPAYSTGPRGSEWPRDWLDFDHYQVVHARYMDVLYRDGFVHSDSLAFTLFTLHGAVRQVSLEGVICCSNDVDIEVTKYMDTRMSGRRLQVLSTYYRYHAYRPLKGGGPVLRYDCAHDHLHYHRFDPAGTQVRYDSLAFADMPRLDSVVREAVDLVRAWDTDSS
jgi:hypothetical protein